MNFSDSQMNFFDSQKISFYFKMNPFALRILFEAFLPDLIAGNDIVLSCHFTSVGFFLVSEIGAMGNFNRKKNDISLYFFMD